MCSQGVLQSWWRNGRRHVLVVMVFTMVVFFLQLLVHHRVVQPFSLLRLRAGTGEGRRLGEAPVTTQSSATTLSHSSGSGVGEGRRLGERLVTTRSPAATPPRPSTVGRGSKTKNHSIKDTSFKNKNLQDNPLKNMVILRSWPPKVRFPLMAFTNLGRLGNRLNSYATALTFHAKHQGAATVAVTLDSMQQLVSLLDPTNLTLPIVDRELLKEAQKKGARVGVSPNYAKNDMVSHLEPTFQRAEKKYRETGEPKVYALDGYPNRMWMLAGHHHTIRAAFRFREDLKQKAARFLDEVRQKKGRRDIPFVGFHIRRTDYKGFIKNFFVCSLPGPAFYHSAMNHYRAALQNPVFVVASDNMSYARQHLNASKDVVFSDMKTAAEDMVLLGSCSHSIMTVGSYGFWASFFAGGEVVYPLLNNCTKKPFLHPDHLGPRGYENWKPFDINGGGPV